MPRKYIEGDLNLRKLYLTELPDFLSGVEIRGYFDCIKNKLTSLKNCPSSILGEFTCSFNKQLKTLEGGPTYVDTNYECNDCGLESLKGAPTRAEGMFDCGNNQLKTLDFAPAFVGGMFVCSGNGLKSLLKGPLVVDGSYDCSINKLTNLIGAPERVGGNFDCSDNNLTSLGILLLCASLSGCGGGTDAKINVAPTANPGPSQNVVVGTVVSMDGSASKDSDGGSLTFKWTLIGRPIGSAASLTNPTYPNPKFAVDLAGNYVVSLVVSDGKADSTVATIDGLFSSRIASIKRKKGPEGPFLSQVLP